MSEACRVLGIRKSRTTPYHPQGDGLVERANRTLLNMLASYTQEHPSTWEDHPQRVCMVYNSSLHSTTGYSPFYLMSGHEERLPLDVMYGTSCDAPQTHNTYAAHLHLSLTKAYSRVRKHLQVAHLRQKQNYDQRVYGEPFEPGDLVWLH